MFKLFTKLFFLSMILVGQCYGQAAKIEYFQTSTWAKFQSELPRPHIVVFSSTDCVHCPGTILQISKTIKSSKKKIYLSVVVMDGLSHQDYLLSAPHYAVADKVFAFDGQANAIRHSVNPNWRGLTPYVALLKAHNEPIYILGKPADKDLIALNND